jgi:hypothetical protein
MYHKNPLQFNPKTCNNLGRSQFHAWGRLILVVTVALCATGCARLGENVQFRVEGVEIPDSGRILTDLAANDHAIQSFYGAGTFILESPEFNAKRKFRGSLRFERPHKLHVQGRDRLANITVFRLICVESEFLMEFPRQKEESFYQLEGEEFENVNFSVSPSDIVKEMFLPEEWSGVKKRSIGVVDYVEETNRLVIEMREGRRLHRRLELQQVDMVSPRWVITRHIRFDEYGTILAVTELSEYSRVEDALFPGQVDAYFPTEATRMTFSMRNIQLNTEIDPEFFDIRTRAIELGLSGRTSASETF